MDDTEKKEEKAEEAAEESKESAEEAKDSSEKAEDSAEESKDSAEEAKESEEKAEEAEDKAKESVNEAKEAVEEVKAVSADRQEEKKEEPKKEIKVSAKLGDIIKDIEKLSVMELSELVKALEEKFGVSAAAPVAVAGAAPAKGGEDEQEEGQTSFNVVLTEGGANKISVIKAVRELVPTLGLKEAKDLVDGAPKQVLEGVGKDAANEAKKKLETAGGKVELK